MSLISADRIKSLKARVKAECLRRNYTTANGNSVANYGGTSYDFTYTPEASKVASFSDHWGKVSIPLNAINSTIFTQTFLNQRIISSGALLKIENFLTTAEATVLTDTTKTDCSGGCTGLCYTVCTGTCTGSCSSCTSCSSCSGCSGCTSSCAQACADGCTSRCTGCRGLCSLNCTGGCSAGACTGTCSGTCSGCTSGCTFSCVGLVT